MKKIAVSFELYGEYDIDTDNIEIAEEKALKMFKDDYAREYEALDIDPSEVDIYELDESEWDEEGDDGK
jgi:hypothetical protein